MEKERINYLDYAKGVSILLVVLGHIYYSDNPIKIWIYSFHMPLFFIISGFLSTNYVSNDKTRIIKKFKSLIIPYILFGGIIIFFKIIFNAGLTGVVKSYILYFLTGTGLDALWFLPALFLIEVYNILIYKINNKYLRISIVTLLFLFGLLGKNIYLNMSLITLYRSFVGLGFFIFGKYTFKLIKKIDLSYLNTLILFIITIILALKNKCIDLWGLNFNNIPIYILCSILGSFTVIMFFKKICNVDIKVLKYFSLNSLILMATHQPILDIINKITGFSYYKMIIGIFVFIIILIIEIPIIYIINTHFPYILGKVKRKEKTEIELA